MRKIFTYCLIFPIAVICSQSFAQDAIYQIDERKINCKIKDITAKSVKYSNPANPGPTYSLDKSMLLMAFNESGNYIVFSGTDAASTSNPASFLNSNAKRDFDILITIDNEVIASQIDRVGDSDISYKKYDKAAASASSTPVTVSKANVLIILHRDGRHELLISPTDAATVLRTLKPKVNELLSNGSEPASQTSTLATTAVQVEANNATTAGVANFDIEEYRNKALQKIDEFGEYVNNVSNKTTPFEEANKAIELACELFLNKGVKAYVEVSNVFTKKKDKRLVRNYLEKLKLTKYDKVEVILANIEFVSDLKKGTDGNYYGVVTFEQKFTGYVDGKPIYSDLVKKHVTVVLKGYTTYDEGQAKEMWDVFLADIEVVETRS
ncbi:MAG: hypothetical protein V4714_06885 [Bacteroidota bacterium]